MAVILTQRGRATRKLFKVPAGSINHLAGLRNFTSSSPLASSLSSNPLVELREYAIHPQYTVDFLQATTKAAKVRKDLLPLRFFSLPETGGSLNVATHAYYYQEGHSQRDTTRAKLADNLEWNQYLQECRPYLQSQSSNLYVEAPLVQKYDEISGLAPAAMSSVGDFSTLSSGNDGALSSSSSCIFEIRRYKLILGYDTVPKFLQLYEGGLPSKLHAEGTDPTTSLISLLYTEVGRLNEVIELWRHGGGTSAMETSRAAARSAAPWRQAIADIAPLALEFTSTIHKPTSFSPIR